MKGLPKLPCAKAPHDAWGRARISWAWGQSQMVAGITPASVLPMLSGCSRRPTDSSQALSCLLIASNPQRFDNYVEFTEELEAKYKDLKPEDSLGGMACNA